MNFKFKTLITSVALMSLAACSDDSSNIPQAENADLTKQITIQLGTTYQTIEGFAASDCWTGNYVGNHWDESEKEGIARLLFSSEVKDNQPEGIGLSMWRFNLGGGTAEQGDASDITDKTTRAECFLTADGTLDWTRQAGQQYFLEKARDYGCEKFVMFSNTPPVHYTFNGKGYSEKGAYANLRPECYSLFANYMADVADYFKKEKNIEFNLISPVNEPQYNWEVPGQEGSGWQNSEIKKLSVELDRAIEEKNLTDTKILVPEAADWEYLYKVKSGTGRSNVINDFFDPSSANYMGDLKHVYPAVAGHSYWTDGTWSDLTNVRTQVAAAAQARNLKVYQTEWSMLGDYGDGYPGHDNASFLDMALYMSRVIHSDLTVANVSSWSYWTSLGVERWSHKIRFLLIRLTPAGGPYGDIEESGYHDATKNLWVLGNYSLFVRPGFKRVALDITNPSNLFFGSAYISPDNKQLVVVYTNNSKRSIGLDTAMPGLNREIESVKRYTTSATQDLEEEELPHDRCTIQPQSVMTLVYQLK